MSSMCFDMSVFADVSSGCSQPNLLVCTHVATTRVQDLHRFEGPCVPSELHGGQSALVARADNSAHRSA